MKITLESIRALLKRDKFWFALASVCTAIGMYVAGKLDLLGVISSIFVAADSAK